MTSLGIAGLAHAQQKSYVNEALAGDAVRLEALLKDKAPRIARPADQLRREGETALSGGDARRALGLLSIALAADSRDSAAWLAFSRAALAIAPADWSERYRLQEQATTAAYQAYQRASSPTSEAAALAQLGAVYTAREIWRPALNAYKASLDRADAPAIRKTYEELRERHGFRILDYKVDSDSASPRACFEFSEALQDKVDFTPFVAVSGSANAAVTGEARQVCVDGLRHGERYAFVIRQGLPSSVGETLLRSADYEIYVKDRSPQVRFTGRNYVLPRLGQEGIPVVSVNTAEIKVDVVRVGDRNLLPTVRSEDFLAQIGRSSADSLAEERGVRIWSGTLEAKTELNRDVVTAFPVMEAVGKLEPGVYVMTARADATIPADEDYGQRATQWFIVSDIGLSALSGRDGVHVFARSLATAAPAQGVAVQLVARNNEILASATTDGSGHARFDPGLSRGTGGLAAGLVTATLAGDYAFLDLGQTAFDLSDRGVKGRPAPGALEAQVYPERGVYRSGETVHLTALLRDARASAAPKLPLTLVVKRPDGVEYRRVQVEDQGLGGRAVSLPILPGAQRGTWRVSAYVDPKGPAVGDTAFLVEDYVPERLEFDIAARNPTLRPGQPAELAVAARYLFGAPGADLDVSGEVVVGPAAAHAVPGLAGYVIGLEDEEVEASTAAIEESATTDAQGQASLTVPIPELAAARPLEAKIILRVGETGGRAVERSVTLPILPAGPVIGVRKTFGGDLAEGALATFDVVGASPDGQRLSGRPVTWTLSRIERRYQWYNTDGRWGYEPVTSTRRVADGRLDLSAEAPVRITAPVTWGQWRLDVKGEGPDAPQTSVSFTVGWGGEATADTPDVLDLSLDKTAYAAGETMKVRVNSRFDGRATLAVVSDKVHETLDVAVARGGTTLDVPVKAEWGAGAYLVASAYRPLDQAARRQPGRALGLAWFSVDRAARSLTLDLKAPAAIRPRGKLTLPVSVGNLQPGEEAYVSVAAVDVGILNLTRYQAPDPGAFFLGQKQLATEIRDLYGFLIDGMQGTRGEIRSGGDSAPPALSAAPPAQEPLARYSGVVRVGPDGTAEIEFDIPAFNGTVRVMGVAWTQGKLGQASADVTIRDPVVVAGTLPRFLSIGDQSRLHLQIDNVEGEAGDYVVSVEPAGPVLIPADALRKTVRLAAGGRAEVTIPVAGAGSGTATFDVSLTGPNLAVAQSFRLGVQPGTAGVVRREMRPLAPGASLTVSADLAADILPGSGAVSVTVSPLASLDVPGLLQALDRYPYGCSEQIVSRAMPLLYVNALAATQALGQDRDADERVRKAVERVLARQGSNGAFGLWTAGGSDDVWLDAYVTDFLTRARERGFAVPQTAFGQALDRLRNHVANTTEVDPEGGSALAYAAYVLARNGRPVMGDLRYLADTKLSAFTTPLARAQIAAALALLGDRGRAQAALASAVEQLRGQADTRGWRPDYGSRLRDGAGMLSLISEAGLPGDAATPVARAIADERRAHGSTSTQENAWMVLAAQAVQKQAAAIALEVGGAPHQGALYATYGDQALAGRPVVIRNTGTVAAEVALTVTGNPIGPEPAEQKGYAVERTYFRLDGTQVDPREVTQNERLVTVLRVTDAKLEAARLLLVDRLPGGFEVDNPALVDSGAVGALDWLKTEVTPETVEYRDDRVVAAFERRPGQSPFLTIAYIVRAVAPGRYVHPPAIAEDMYRPERYGRTAFGTVEVKAAR